MARQRVAVFEIKRYMVIWRQLEVRDFGEVQARIRGLVRCSGIDASGQQEYRLDVYFLAPKSPMPAPQVDIANRRGAIFMEISDIHAFVDILRNEKPIFGHLRGDHPQWTSITTANEPVGTGDEDHRPGE
ncbi:MAG: hypothetical protein OXE95_01435 [Chloroflexi bacterium]|nr:hypothetical protein [Chloroflexota bacterium]MCY4246222.1 hypothetical protein [Chloroflexota bacterium]